MDPERGATRPFAYDPGPVGENPRGALRTYGLHLTGLSFTLFGDPARAGLDVFTTTWSRGLTNTTGSPPTGCWAATISFWTSICFSR